MGGRVRKRYRHCRVMEQACWGFLGASGNGNCPPEPLPQPLTAAIPPLAAAMCPTQSLWLLSPSCLFLPLELPVPVPQEGGDYRQSGFLRRSPIPHTSAATQNNRHTHTCCQTPRTHTATQPPSHVGSTLEETPRDVVRI